MGAETGPLAGITVVEVGVFMAAPFATMQLADLGARVVKVEPAAGDPMRASGPILDGHSSPFVRLNRNKESVTLDLKDPQGHAAFLALVDAADVVVENLRPGAMRRLGLDHDALAADRPRLVYASASGWGQDGPDAHLPGLDIMAQARSGLMSVTGERDGPPAKVGVPVCDLTCGLYVALAVVAALHERTRSGRGQHIDVSLLESGVSLAVYEAATWFATGAVPGRLGSAHQSNAPYQAVHAADGDLTLGANTPATWTALCAALGLEHLPTDPRYADPHRRMQHRTELVADIEAVTRTRTVADLVAALRDAGVPCAELATYDAVFTDPHLHARDFFFDTPHPDLGAVRQLGNPMRFSRSPVRRDHAGPPLAAPAPATPDEEQQP